MIIFVTNWKKHSPKKGTIDGNSEYHGVTRCTTHQNYRWMKTSFTSTSSQHGIPHVVMASHQPCFSTHHPAWEKCRLSFAMMAIIWSNLFSSPRFFMKSMRSREMVVMNYTFRCASDGWNKGTSKYTYVTSAEESHGRRSTKNAPGSDWIDLNMFGFCTKKRWAWLNRV